MNKKYPLKNKNHKTLSLHPGGSEDFEIVCCKAGQQCEASAILLRDGYIKHSRKCLVEQDMTEEDSKEKFVNMMLNEIERDNDEIEFELSAVQNVY